MKTKRSYRKRDLEYWCRIQKTDKGLPRFARIVVDLAVNYIPMPAIPSGRSMTVDEYAKKLGIKGANE